MLERVTRSSLRITCKVANFSSSDAVAEWCAVPGGFRHVEAQLVLASLFVKLNSIYAPDGPEQHQKTTLLKLYVRHH